MIDVTGKQTTLRTATAEGRILCEPFVLERVRANDLPKGNLFDVARAAGLLAAKNTALIIPHCHPVSIDGMELEFQIETDGIVVRCKGKSIGRTGIEMEALTAVSAAALTIYDLLKPLKGQLEIASIKLLEKTGGKTQWNKYARKGMTACVLVSSDSTAAGKRQDKSGLIIKEMLEGYGIDVKEYSIVPDESEPISAKIRAWADEGINFIFTTGGTGLGPRDRTADTVRELTEREAPGIVEAMRSFGQARTPLAMLSRSTAGILKKTVIVTLPGSSNGARESLQAVLPGLFHAHDMLRGKGH